MGDRYGVSQVTDHAYRIVGIDHLQEPTLLQRFSFEPVDPARRSSDQRDRRSMSAGGVCRLHADKDRHCVSFIRIR